MVPFTWIWNVFNRQGPSNGGSSRTFPVAMVAPCRLVPSFKERSSVGLSRSTIASETSALSLSLLGVCFGLLGLLGDLLLDLRLVSAMGWLSGGLVLER